MSDRTKINHLHARADALEAWKQLVDEVNQAGYVSLLDKHKLAKGARLHEIEKATVALRNAYFRAVVDREG